MSIDPKLLAPSITLGELVDEISARDAAIESVVKKYFRLERENIRLRAELAELRLEQLYQVRKPSHTCKGELKW